MKQSHRLPTGGRIDRNAPLTFRFNAKTISAYAGDTLASALLANGVHLVGRSFKYHRPRGILGHGSEEPNALVEIDRGAGRIDPNSRATQVEATRGIIARSQNHWPTLEHDFGALNDLLSPLLVAGFYYKTFMWPRSFWDRVYEPRIRAAAGLGRAPRAADPDRYVHRHAHCDVLVIGAGPAGLAAALAASRSGRRIIVADEQSELGGSLLHERGATIGRMPASEWVEVTVGKLRELPNVELLPRTTAFGFYNHNYVALVERVTDHLCAPPRQWPRERLWQVRAAQVVLATGAHERPLVFADNDRPGIMLAESIRHYINRYAVAPGRRIVFATNGASAYAAAADARAAGIDVTLVDVRPETQCHASASELRARGVEVLTGHTIVGSTGRRRVAGLIVAPLEADGGVGARRTLPCDCVGISGGWTPAVHLFSQSRGKLRFDQSLDAFLPDRSVQRERSAGACRGTYDLAACLNEGWAAGLAATQSTCPRAFSTSPPTPTGFAASRALRADAGAARRRAFVDFQNDVTVRDIEVAVREGFESVEHLKRYTTIGMATDQGKTSNMTALGLLSQAVARPIQELGTTTYRPPYTPVSFGALVGASRGELFEPTRTTPMHDWAAARGAKFENVGQWKRAWYFPRADEDMQAAVSRECSAVRRCVGIFDASTLGKIEVVGPDGAEFMNRMYINGWSKLEPGRCRYGVMLKEDGYIFDDGVVARIAPDVFHATTTTGGAARVLAHMEDYLQTEWPDLKVFVTSTTEQWAVIAVQGPRSREVLAPLVDVDLSPRAFPHMSVRTGHICGVPMRLFRVSFTGELGYEINVPADHARGVWELVYTSGERFGITPYGTQTMHVLRAERGFIVIGQETDGTVTPDDVGLGGMIGRAKADFVGKRSLNRPDLTNRTRKQLVGLLTLAPDIVPDEGAHVVIIDREKRAPMRVLGHVTSSYWSAACGRSIALALLDGGRGLHGRVVHVTSPSSGFTTAEVTKPVFVESRAERDDE